MFLKFISILCVFQQQLIFQLHRAQLIDIHHKSFDGFLYDGNIGCCIITQTIERRQKILFFIIAI